ncbi:MAG: hypothetical protein AB1760_10640 [Pseudomonadota bacterium]
MSGKTIGIAAACVGAAAVSIYWLVTAAALSVPVINSVQSLPYSAELSQLDTRQSDLILFTRTRECGPLENCDDFEVFSISADGSGLQSLVVVHPAAWPAANLAPDTENTIVNGCGGSYTGAAVSGDKRIEIIRDLFSIEMVMTDGGGSTVLERRRGLSPDLGFASVQWLLDGRHLLIEDQNRRDIAIYDTETRGYAFLADGMFPVVKDTPRSFESHM